MGKGSYCLVFLLYLAGILVPFLYSLIHEYYCYQFVVAGLLFLPIYIVFYINNPLKTLLGTLVFSISINPGFPLVQNLEYVFGVFFIFRLSDFVLIIIILHLLLKKIYNKQHNRIYQKSIIITLTWIWFGFGILSLVWAEDNFSAAIEILRMARLCLTLLILTVIIESKNDWLFVIYCFVIFCTIQALLIPLQLITASQLIRLPGGCRGLDIILGPVEFFRPGGTLGHSSNYAKLAALVTPICFVLSGYAKKTKQKFFWGICLAFLLLSLIITMSRAGILCCFAGLFIMIFLLSSNRRERKRIISLTVVLILILVVSWSIGGSRVLFRFNNDYGSAESRIPQWETAVRLILHHPEGVGLNNYVNTAVQYDATGLINAFPFPVHNIFLLYFSEIGIVGGTVFLIMLSAPVFIAFKLSKQVNDGIEKSLLIAIGVGIISSWVQGLTGWGHRSSEVHFLCFALLSALIVVYGRFLQNPKGLPD